MLNLKAKGKIRMRSIKRSLEQRTRRIAFGCSFVLTEYATLLCIKLLLTDMICLNYHNDDAVATGPKFCRSLADFIFKYAGASYDAHNSASTFADETVFRLAKACPKLQKVEVQTATSPTDQSLPAFP